MARVPRADHPPPDPEITRAGFSELTRCDHCQQLDGGTNPTLEFNDHPGDGWIWLHDVCRPIFQALHIERQTDSQGRVRIEKGRGGLDMDEMLEGHTCDYCGKKDGRTKLTAIGSPGVLEVFEAWLHPECERGYLRLTFPDEQS